jgi:hypothetical protein
MNWINSRCQIYLAFKAVPFPENSKSILRKEKKMKRIYRFVLIVFFTVISAGFLSMPHADAEEGACVLEASNKDVFVIVFDQDDEGNKGNQIWQGRINAGESVKITAPHAQIRYSYNDQPDEDQPLSGDVDRSCDGGEKILVP